MGYNLTNATNGKSISKIPKWRSLMRSLTLKSKFIGQFEFLEKFRGFVWKILLESNGLFFQQLFPYKSS